MTMIDRVARVLQSHMEAAFVHGVPDDLSFVAVDLASAAIAAMREPSDTMVEAADFVDNGWGGYIGATEARNCWQAMICSALSE